MVDRRALANLDEVLTPAFKAQAIPDMDQVFVNKSVFDGARTSLPLWPSPAQSIFYRKDALAEIGLEAPPLSWHAFADAAGRLTKGNRLGLGLPSNDNSVSSLLNILSGFGTAAFDPATWPIIGRSLVFTFGSLAVSVPLALLTALAVRQLGPRGRLLLTVLLVPWAMSPIVVALLWKWILLPSPGGLLASIFITLGGSPVSFLTNPALAMPTVIVVGVWRNFAFAAIILTAGLGQIPQDLYRAAAVDGLGVVERFRRITPPLRAVAADRAVRSDDQLLQRGPGDHRADRWRADQRHHDASLSPLPDRIRRA